MYDTLRGVVADLRVRWKVVHLIRIHLVRDRREGCRESIGLRRRRTKDVGVRWELNRGDWCWRQRGSRSGGKWTRRVKHWIEGVRVVAHVVECSVKGDTMLRLSFILSLFDLYWGFGFRYSGSSFCLFHINGVLKRSINCSVYMVPKKEQASLFLDLKGMPDEWYIFASGFSGVRKRSRFIDLISWKEKRINVRLFLYSTIMNTVYSLRFWLRFSGKLFVELSICRYRTRIYMK